MTDQAPQKPNWGLTPEELATHKTIFAPDLLEGQRFLITGGSQGMGKAMGRGEMSRTDGFQRDGIHPNAQGVKLNVAEIGPYAMKLYARAGG